MVKAQRKLNSSKRASAPDNDLDIISATFRSPLGEDDETMHIASSEDPGSRTNIARSIIDYPEMWPLALEDQVTRIPIKCLQCCYG